MVSSVRGRERSQMIFQHYRELVTEKEEEAWFAITPERAEELRERMEWERAGEVLLGTLRGAVMEKACLEDERTTCYSSSGVRIE